MAGSAGDKPKKVDNHLLATQGMLCVLLVVKRLGDTIEQARRIGDARDANDVAECWFDARKLTLTARIHTPYTEGGHTSLIGLIENGYHGYVGPFEVDSVTEESGYVVVQLREGSDREPLDDPETLVAAAVRLLP